MIKLILLYKYKYIYNIFIFIFIIKYFFLHFRKYYSDGKTNRIFKTKLDCTNLHNSIINIIIS